MIYWDNLLTRGRGSPIWLPEPTSVNDWFRRHGVSIGDVGLLLPTGGFLFLFNICYPREHEINSGGVPDSFVPLGNSLDPRFISKTSEQPGYSITSSLVKKRLRPGLRFKSHGKEGAILALPSGMYSEDLFATRDFRDYIVQHIVSWYRYIIHDRRCQIENGDVRVVTGFSKTSQWGVAAFSESSLPIRLRLQPKNRGQYLHVWEYTGSCDTRSGPPLSSETRGSTMASNQCVFLRTLNATFCPEAWYKLKQNNFKKGITNAMNDVEFKRNLPIMTYGVQNAEVSQPHFMGESKFQEFSYAIPNVPSAMVSIDLA